MERYIWTLSAAGMKHCFLAAEKGRRIMEGGNFVGVKGKVKEKGVSHKTDNKVLWLKFSQD